MCNVLYINYSYNFQMHLSQYAIANSQSVLYVHNKIILNGTFTHPTYVRCL